MKSNEQLAKEIIKKAKTARRKKRVVASSVTLFVCSLLLFLVGYSNIITIDFNPYKNSYLSYLSSYLSTEHEVGFRFVDKQSAVVQIEGRAYPCAYRANSKTEFTLTVVENEEESLSRSSETAPKEEEPSVFYLEFWDTSAKLSWNIFGTKIEKILSVTKEQDIPAGLWSLCATQDGDNGKIVEKKNGAGWTLILENGDSYTGEGIDSAWKTKFVSVGDKLFQCMFDPVSGVILDASMFVYDETTFPYPVIREHYLSDGEPYYFYSRQLADEEKVDFTGGSFTAKAALREVENHRVKNPSDLLEEAAKWQFSTEKSQEKSELSISAALDLNEDGSVELEISGDDDFDGSFEGTWYALKHSILITLDKKSSLLGNAFTLYVDNYNAGELSGELIQKYAQSYIESYGCYKVGYHNFDYYVLESRTDIFWGNKWAPEQLTPTVKYEQEYVLYGEYYYEYFDGDPNIADANREKFDESFLQPLPINGQVKVVFHKNGKATVTLASGEVREIQYTLNEDGSRVIFAYELNIYQGKNAVGKNPWHPENVDKNCIVNLYYLDFGFTYLYRKWGENWSYSYKDENGNWVQENYSQTFYTYRLILQNE